MSCTKAGGSDLVDSSVRSSQVLAFYQPFLGSLKGLDALKEISRSFIS